MEKGGKAEVGRRRRGEEAGDETGTERNSTSDWGAIQLPSYIHGYILYTLGLEAPMWCVQGGTVAVRTVGLGTRNSELGTPSSGLGIPLGSAEHGGRVAGDLRGTLNVDPNPNGILPLHRYVGRDGPPSVLFRVSLFARALPAVPQFIELAVVVFVELFTVYRPNRIDEDEGYREGGVPPDREEGEGEGW